MGSTCCNPWPPITGGPHTIINIGGEVEWYSIGTGPNPFELRTAKSDDGSVVITQFASTVDFSVDFDGNVSIINIGGFFEVFRVSTFNPFELRTFQSSDSSISFVQNVDNLDLKVDFDGNVSIRNVGGEAEFYKVATSNPFDLRTAYSSDLSVEIIQEVDKVNFKVEGGTPFKAFQVDTTATGGTGNNSYTTIATIAGDAKVLDGEEWKFNVCVMICHPVGLSTVNTFVQWQIETSAGVFSEIDEWQINWPISISGGDPSTPTHRTKNVTVSMDAPRMRCRQKMSSFVATGTLMEHPRWGGVIIEPAPPP